MNGLYPFKDTKFIVQAWTGDDPAKVIKTADDLDVVKFFDWFIIDAETREFMKLTGFAGPASTSNPALRFYVRGKLYLQQYFIKNNDYKMQHVELYGVNADGSVKKQFSTKLGDIRLLQEVSIDTSRAK